MAQTRLAGGRSLSSLFGFDRGTVSCRLSAMTTATSDYLTVHELAALLRVKERKVYALAAAGEIPCNRATGKLLFPRASVQKWMAQHESGATFPAGQPVERPAVVAGSHDPLLDWALRESRCGLATLFDGSLDGLDRLASDRAIAAGLHLREPAADGWNRSHVREALGDAPVVLFEWAWRQRGLLVAAGNPKGIESLGDIARVRLMPRQAEAGSQVLLEALLAEAGTAPGDLDRAAPAARNEADLAAAITGGQADVGFGLEGVAHQYRLDFVPVLRERFDIAVFRRDYFERPFQAFLAFCRSPALAAKAAELGGYDLAGFGTVHYNGP